MAKDHNENYSHYLAPGEKMRHFTGLSGAYLLRRFCIKFIFPGVLVIVAATAIGLYVFALSLLAGVLLGYACAFLVSLVFYYFESRGTQYILTDRRIIIQQGYFNVSLTSASYDKITHVNVNQSFIERTMYKFGKVIVHTAGSNNREIVIENIAQPMQFKNLLEKLIDESVHEHTPEWKRHSGSHLKRLLAK